MCPGQGLNKNKMRHRKVLYLSDTFLIPFWYLSGTFGEVLCFFSSFCRRFLYLLCAADRPLTVFYGAVLLLSQKLFSIELEFMIISWCYLWNDSIWCYQINDFKWYDLFNHVYFISTIEFFNYISSIKLLQLIWSI